MNMMAMMGLRLKYDDYEHENYSVMMMDDDNESNTSDDTEKNF